ncbi:MAG: hypothetical protein E5V64_06510 [Mesorhizobium sp.]|uniref:hypothetical protein n=1 Tax=Mesorhizobium sp. TaxID=1871066 RepID=UPI00120104C9|nr:hypothetical protein [Mesorhizobium sp.]TIV83812.1 MAG: hypothetical protein E5V64_06510 [Mesorhizobium sp.]
MKTIERVAKAIEDVNANTSGLTFRELTIVMATAAVEVIGDRDWNMNMDEAPRDGTIIEAVARYPNATAGFPRYIGWIDGTGWCEFSRYAPETVVPWAWRPRTGWPQEPRPSH